MSCLRTAAVTRLGQVITLELDQLSTELMLPARTGGRPGGTGRRSQIRYARGEGAILEGDFAPFHDATVRPATGTEVRAWLERSGRHGAKLPLGELALAHRRALPGGRRRLQPAHVLVRSVGVGQDLLARGDPRAAADRDGPAPGDPRSELGLRAPGNGAGRRRPGAGRTLPAGGARRHRPIPPTPRASGGCACTRPRSIRRRRRPCSGWTRSRTARSTPPWPDMLAREDRSALEALPDSERPRGAPPRPARPQPRCRPLHGVGARRGGLGPRRGARSGHPLRRHRPGLAADARGAVAGRRRGAG